MAVGVYVLVYVQFVWVLNAHFIVQIASWCFNLNNFTLVPFEMRRTVDFFFSSIARSLIRHFIVIFYIFSLDLLSWKGNVYTSCNTTQHNTEIYDFKLKNSPQREEKLIMNRKKHTHILIWLLLAPNTSRWLKCHGFFPKSTFKTARVIWWENFVFGTPR